MSTLQINNTENSIGIYTILYMDTLSQRIANRRRELGLYQAEVARVAGITQPKLSLIESKPTNLQINSLIALARALNTTVSDLTEGL